MRAFREIRKVESDTVTVRIPREFREKQIEIIVLPYTDVIPDHQQTELLMEFDRMVENAEKRNLKIDKAIDIDELMNEMNNGLC